MQDVKRRQCGRNAACGQVQHHRPINVPGACEFDCAAHFGEGGKQQISADRQMRLGAEEEDQDGRHQRAAAYTRESHDGAHKKTREYERQILHGGDCRACPLY